MARGWYGLFLFLHILSAVVGFGATIANGVIASRVERAPEPQRLGLVETAYTIGTRVILPGSFAVFLTGAGVVLSSHKAWSFKQSWVVIGIVLWAVLSGLGAMVFTRTEKRIIEIERSGAGAASAELAALHGRLRVAIPISHVLLAAVIFDMVWKPFFP